MPFNTRNPIPSGDLRDLDDNARNIDTWANDKTKLSHPDRFGVERYTWHGIEQKAQLDIADAAHDAAAEAADLAAAAATAQANDARDAAFSARDQAIAAKLAAMNAAASSGVTKYADTKAILTDGVGTTYINGDVVLVFADESQSGASAIYKIEANAAVFKTIFDQTRADLLSFTGNISADAEWSDVPAHSDPAFDVQTQALANRIEWLGGNTLISFTTYSEMEQKSESIVDGAEIEISSTGRRYKKDGENIYPADDKAAVRYVDQDASQEQKEKARNNIDAQQRFLFDNAASATNADGLNSVSLSGYLVPNDMRGALYEKGVPSAASYSDDLKLNIDGEVFVNRQGWQRCRGKRYGRIVVLGSSTPAGVGATGYFLPSASNGFTESPNSWVGRMRAALGGDGEVINRSFGGDSSSGGLSRFWRDVAPYSPDTVIIAEGYVNEPQSGGNPPNPRRQGEVYTRWLRLISLCAKIGAKPIVAVTMAGDASLLRTYGIASALRQHGVAVWDLSASVKPLNSDAIDAAYSIDGTHVNDAGHLRYFQNINIADLDLDMRCAGKQQISKILGKDGYYVVGPTPASADGEYAPLTAFFIGQSDDMQWATRPLDICVYAKVKAPLATGNTYGTIISLESTSSTDHPQISVRGNYTSTPYWGLYADGEKVLESTVEWDTDEFAEAIISYDRGKNRFDYFQNGVFVGSYTPPVKTPATNAGWAWVRCGGATGFHRLPEGWEIHDFVVTRNPSMNGSGMRGANNTPFQLGLALPATMGARFPVAVSPLPSTVVNNIEDDVYSRLFISGVSARLYRD